MACLYCAQAGDKHSPDCPRLAADPESAAKDWERGKKAAESGTKYQNIPPEDSGNPHYLLGFFKGYALKESKPK